MSCNINGKVKDKKIIFEEIINKNIGYSKINNIKIIYQQIIEYYDKNMRYHNIYKYL